MYLACADEEAGGTLGAGHVCEQHWDALRADYCLTENGGTVSRGTAADELNVTVHVGEKGVAWRRLRVKGTPGHGSMPYGADNALVKAAQVVSRLADYRPVAVRRRAVARRSSPRSTLDPAVKAALVDPVARRRVHRRARRRAWPSTRGRPPTPRSRRTCATAA